MKIDQATLEAIVREVVQRLLAANPDLLAGFAPDGDAADQDVYEHYGRVLSESDLIACRKLAKRAIRCDARAIVTPLARERAKDLCIRIVQR